MQVDAAAGWGAPESRGHRCRRHSIESDARRERQTTAKPSIYNDKKLNVASCRGDAGTPQSSPGNGASNLRMDHEYKRAVTPDTTKPAMQAILQPKHDPEIQMQSWMCDR